MSKEITRIGVYWHPPQEFTSVLRALWRGELARDYLDKLQQCESDEEREAINRWQMVSDLTARHCGECPIWDVHATVLDAICILADDQDQFIKAMAKISQDFLPLTLDNPTIKEWGWGDNVFLRWDGGEDSGREQLKRLRTAMAKEASKFMVVECVSWEVVNQMNSLLVSLGPAASSEFREAFQQLKSDLLADKNPRLPYAPNVGLDWYISRLMAGKALNDDRLPFPPSPHISIASAVRPDEKYNMTAKEVGTFIKDHLQALPEFAGMLGPQIAQQVQELQIVQPLSNTQPPMQITVIDRAAGCAKTELRQPWGPSATLKA